MRDALYCVLFVVLCIVCCMYNNNLIIIMLVLACVCNHCTVIANTVILRATRRNNISRKLRRDATIIMQHTTYNQLAYICTTLMMVTHIIVG